MLEEEERVGAAREDPRPRLGLKAKGRVVRDAALAEERDDVDEARQSDSSSVQRSFSSVFFTMLMKVSPSAPSTRRWSNVTPM